MQQTVAGSITQQWVRVLIATCVAPCINYFLKPGACPQPAEAHTWFTEFGLTKPWLYVCVFMCLYVCMSIHTPM